MTWVARRTRQGRPLAARSVALLILLVSAGASRVWAFDDAAVRTARLAYFYGDVTILRPDNTGGDPAQLNMPLTEGARVRTGDDGQAEMEFEDGSLLRMTPQSSVLLSRLGSGANGGFETQISLLNGLVYAELRAASKYAYRIDAGGDVVTPVANATVRITLDQPPAAIAVLDGTAHVDRTRGNGYQVDVNKGESLKGDAAGGGRYFLAQGIEHNTWDDWNEEREQGAANELAARTAARDGFAGDQGYGWSDLDADGTWYDTGQGPVWQPFDAGVSGFDPYGYGSWVYYTGPGYVWSSGYRWGWTPFRCGSWSYWTDFGWGWSPSGTGGYGGWGVGGYGPGGVRRTHRINLSNLPPGYQRPLPPVPGGPLRVHPIITVRSGPAPTGERVRAFEARQIAGQTAVPLRTVGGGYTSRGGSAVGSSLRRDFPIDRTTRQPVLGSVTAPAGRRGPDAAAGSRTVEATPGVVGSAGMRTGAAGSDRSGFNRSGAEGFGVERRRSPDGEAGRPVYPGTPARNAVLPPGSSVPSPPPTPTVSPLIPQRARVHPGDRSEREYPGNRGLPQNAAPRPAPMLGERSTPSPPPSMRSAPPPSLPSPSVPMRSAPVPSAPMPMRSAPMPSAPASPPVRSAPAGAAPSPAGAQPQKR